jgi:hypothetical protein
VLTVRYDRCVKKLVQIMWIPVLVTALYVGWVLWQRHTSLTPVAHKPAEEDPLARYRGQVQIVQFYSANGAILRGGKTELCYGVVNAKEVRLDPPVEKVWPSISRCFDVAPAKTTHYTLTAESANHKVVTASLDVTVQR